MGLIVNADDWGRDKETTDRTLECVLCSSISSVSAMVFMQDSERAAAIAGERGIDTGLHLNFTTPFTAARSSARIGEHLESVAGYLRKYRLAPVVFHPGLTQSFEYLVSSQREEFARLFGKEPERLDGHHHMHLCANVLLGGLLPEGTRMRRNFSFQRGEKSSWNRLYRRASDHLLARRHSVTDFFYALLPLDPPSRLQRIFAQARDFSVEVETHPVNPPEYSFLTEGGIFRSAGKTQIKTSHTIPAPESMA
jgi:predicted glycoside hydrolase/deacetylase ChbG (UPF0249 family)